MPKGVPLTEEEQARRRCEIFQSAVHMFVEKGFTETSMREVAEAAGVGKSTLYDYFKTKDEILISYFEDEIVTITQLAAQIGQQDLPAEQKLRQILMAQLDYLLANKRFYMKLSVEAQRLTMDSQARIHASRHAYQDLVCKIIEAGIAEGSFRSVDPYLTMRVILAAVNTVVFTTRPTGTAHHMLDMTLDIILNGIQEQAVPAGSPDAEKP
jgi:TetR/AcrR family transcriptional regulator, cholesterol catabolism regulator